MSQYAASRFGQDAPARISGTTTTLLEASDQPGEPMYQPVIPFYPGGVVSGSAAALGTTSSNGDWDHVPTDLDITFYEGDDVVIPLYLQDPNSPTLDMSDQTDWEWHSQIRMLAYHGSRLVVEFTTDSTYYPPGTIHPTVGTTLVSLFLPRELNTVAGTFSWELYSISPVTYSNEFAKPDDWPTDEVWPPTTTLRTWLNGDCVIKVRTGATDVIAGPVATPFNQWMYGNQAIAAVNTGPFVVGPNGRVP